VAVTPPPQEFTVSVPAEDDSLAVVRRWIRELTEEHLDPERADDLVLIVSELVANSLVHAGLTHGDDIDVVARLTPEAIRITVVDPGSGFPDDWRWRTGMGLRLIERLADRLVVQPGSSVVTVEMSVED
jgi:anti-sigma regulatory factor (Ser/Thr protein kinase)